MHTSTGIILASASGPFGDTLATTRPGQSEIVFSPRRRLKDKTHAADICQVFHDLDEFYHDAPQELHDMWNAYAQAPGISGYDAFMSQGLTATNQGWYVPDLPGEGDGSTPHPIMPGCVIPPPLIVACDPDAKCLVGEARVDVRLSHYGHLEFRYQHSFRDPCFPNPADVTVVILGLWDTVDEMHHLRYVGEVGVNLDSGWVDTYTLPHLITQTAFGHYRYFLLNQQFDLPLGKAVHIPQLPFLIEGELEAGQAPFVDLHDGNAVPLGEFESVYGNIAWTIVRMVQRLPYRWYHLGFTVQLTARPNYQRQVGSIHLRGFYDRVNHKWRLNLRGKLRTIIRTHQGPGIWKAPWSFYKIVRVDNPSWLGVKFNLTWKVDNLKLTPRAKTIRTFDTARTPVWDGH